jgi:CelD/BcsL family acetyltransferase involved in cellulose biosynthesis
MLGPFTNALGGAFAIPAARSRTGRFEIVVEQGEDDIARRLRNAGGSATAFQTAPWLRAWYETIGPSIGAPLLITATDRATGNLAAMLPLVRRRAGRMRIVEFADHGVSDSNAPILGPAAPTDAADARAMWKAICATLPDVDLVRFTKMPGKIEGRLNPLTLLGDAGPSSFGGNVLTITGSFEDYLGTLTVPLRKQLRKSGRAFEGIDFRRIDNPDEAVGVLAKLERQQGQRLRAQGRSYRLDESAFSAFYCAATAQGVCDGSIILTALLDGEEVVASLLGLGRHDTYVMIRASVDTTRWPNRSPGLLLIVKTMQSLHAEGCRVFDFSIGDYTYKRRLGARSTPLFDLTAALTLRGLPPFAYDRAKQTLRRYPAVRALAHRILRSGQPAPEVANDHA